MNVERHKCTFNSLLVHENMYLKETQVCLLRGKSLYLIHVSVGGSRQMTEGWPQETKKQSQYRYRFPALIYGNGDNKIKLR